MPKTTVKKKTAKTKPVKKTVPKAAAAKPKKEARRSGVSAVKHSAPEVKEEKAENRLTLSVFDTSGKKAGTMTLPGEIFGVKPDKTLLAQAVRVYLSNQRMGHASTKTRGEVEGSTRKIFRQKGTGRARHGGIRAPIFVGGGITFGPQPHSFRKDFPKKMRQLALKMALSAQLRDGNLTVVDGTGEMPIRTKAVAAMLADLNAPQNSLLVIPRGARNIHLAARNIADLDTLFVEELHTYSVLSHKRIIFTKEAIAGVKSVFAKSN